MTFYATRPGRLSGVRYNRGDIVPDAIVTDSLLADGFVAGFPGEDPDGAAASLLTADGQLLTRVGGVPAPITRAALAADPALSATYVAQGTLTADGDILTRAGGAPARAAGLGLIKSGRPNIVFEGDSITTGAASAGPASTAVLHIENYPRLASDGIAGATVTNVAVGGQTVLAMSAAAATQVDPLINTGRLNIVAFLGGTNDIYNGAATPATAYNRVVAYCTARRAAGWKVVVGTILPRDPAAAGAGFEADRQTLNTSIRTNWATFADAIADIGADPTIGAAGAQTNTAYYADLHHPTTLGYEIIATYYRTAFKALGVLMHSHEERSLWLPATEFGGGTAGATLGLAYAGGAGTYLPAWIFPQASAPHVAGSFQLPPGLAQWRTLIFEAYWTIQAAGAGTVTWRVDTGSIRTGGFMSTILTNGPQIAVTAPAAQTIAVSNISNTARTIDAGNVAAIRVLRNGGTSTADAALIGLLVSRAS